MPSSKPRPTMAFWEHVGVPPSLARSRLDLTLGVNSCDSATSTSDPSRNCSRATGLQSCPKATVTVVVTDDYLRPELATWNARSLTSGRPWLLVKPVGIETWIGPLFVPGQTACWECLAQRLRGHRKLEAVHRAAQRHGRSGRCPARLHPFDRSTPPSPKPQRRSRAGSEPEGNRRLLDRVVSTSILTLERAHHALTRRPQCPSCGSPEPQDGMRSRAGAPASTPEGSTHRMEGIAPSTTGRCSSNSNGT